MSRAKGWSIGAGVSLVMWALIIWGVMSIAGCQVTPAVMDPVTGEELAPKTYRVDPNVASTVETIADVTVAAGTVASGFFPWLFPIVMAVGGATASWRRLKPKLTEATAKADLAYKGGSVLADALEEIKKNQPAIWAKIGPKIEKAAGPASETENAIRGFRGMPPK